MFTKLYETILKILKENKKFFLVFLFVFLLSFVELPYYVDAPGGIIDVNSKMEFEGKTNSSGTFNLSYVSEYKGTIPMLFYSMFQKDWKIIKKEEVLLENESAEENNYRSKRLLEETNQNAILVAYQKAGKEVQVTNRELYVTYIDSLAQTELKIKDQLLKVENTQIHTKEELQEILSTYEVGDTISILVKRGEKEVEVSSTISSSNGRKVLGILVTEIKTLEETPQITFSFADSESGPSGGLMMSLAIYDGLVKEDITKGYTIVGTGTMESDGTVGEIGGVEYKIKGAVKAKADIFFVPEGNYEEAKEIVAKEEYQITLVSISSFEDALRYLEQLSAKSN